MSRAWEYAADVTLPGGHPAVGPRVGKIIEQLAGRLIPAGGLIDVSVEETDAYKAVARYLRDLDSGSRLGIKALLLAFDLAPFLFIQRFSRFTRLSPQEQELYLHDWSDSRLYYRRMVVVLLKTIIGLGFYNDPLVLEKMDFHLKCEEAGS